MISTIKSIIAVIMSLITIIFPGFSYEEITKEDIINTGKEIDKEIIETTEELVIFEEMYDNCLLNATIVSDIHIDVDWAIGEWVWANGLNDLERSKDTIDALIVSGDLTNYGDGPSIESFFNIMAESDCAENWVIATGNHDVGHVDDVTQEEARQRFVNLYNNLNPSGKKIEKAYYKTDVNNYRFVVLCDDGDDTWDTPDMSPEQLKFLDASLAEAADRNLPMFVICHVPCNGVNGLDTIWPDNGLNENSDAVKTIMEKYENVFFISGHVHTGINVPLVENVFGFSSVEQHNGVTYVNLPTYMIVNRYGVPWGGMGYQMEVYGDEIIFRARNFFTATWYPVYDHSVELD
ncbi:MAG: metallophosphoesterase [Clostridia bacterium]|nr:metallophosphoesterase [Clostridia bacterium]